MKYIPSLLLCCIILTASFAAAQDNRRDTCLESTVAFYNCMKGTELQMNLGTTYLLGAIQSLNALKLISLPRNKSMLHYRFEYLDYVETNAKVHEVPPGQGVVMYLLDTYGNEENTKGMEYVKENGLVK